MHVRVEALVTVFFSLARWARSTFDLARETHLLIKKWCMQSQKCTTAVPVRKNTTVVEWCALKESSDWEENWILGLTSLVFSVCLHRCTELLPFGFSRKVVDPPALSCSPLRSQTRKKVCSVTSPFFLSNATNSLYHGDLGETMKYIGLYAILAFSAKALKEAQSLVYLK